jgi:FkbM family methyltransferase
MVECAAFWAYYSLWLLARVPTAKVTLVEPDPGNLAVGRENFQLNGRTGNFLNAAISGEQRAAAPFLCESDGAEHIVPYESLPSLWRRLGLERLDLLHIDAQGAEIPFLESGRIILADGRVRFCVVSTHHHSISGDPLAHERCLRLFGDLGAHVVAEHTVAESYSGDGLVCVSFEAGDRDLTAPISRARAGESLFGDPLIDLAQCQQALEGSRGQLGEVVARLQEEELRRTDAERSLAGAIRRRARQSWRSWTDRKAARAPQQARVPADSRSGSQESSHE